MASAADFGNRKGRASGMKVIFLDIDGVINCDQTPNPRKFPYIVDKRLLARLRKVMDATGAKVVLTSTWRCDPVGLLAAKHWKIHLPGYVPTNPEVLVAERLHHGSLRIRR